MGTKMSPRGILCKHLHGTVGRIILRTVNLKTFHGSDSLTLWTRKGLMVIKNLDTFFQEANSFNPAIKFTAYVSSEEHVFLDTKSRLLGNEIDVGLYTKPTDTHQYRLPQICHLKHCKNVPYSLALRIRGICSNPDIFESLP